MMAIERGILSQIVNRWTKNDNDDSCNNKGNGNNNNNSNNVDGLDYGVTFGIFAALTLGASIALVLLALEATLASLLLHNKNKNMLLSSSNESSIERLNEKKKKLLNILEMEGFTIDECLEMLKKK